MSKVVLEEYCKEDGKMSEKFNELVNDVSSKLYTLTCIGLVEKAKGSDYLNSVVYSVELENE